MSLYSCPRQQEVRAALRERRWEDPGNSELQMHVKGCASCEELVLVTQTLRQARQQAISMAPPPTPGLLWWKAQIRSRQKLVERAEKPVAFVERLVIVITLLAIAVFAISERLAMARWLDSLVSAANLGLAQQKALQLGGDGSGVWFILGTATIVLGLVGGLAAYLLMREE